MMNHSRQIDFASATYFSSKCHRGMPRPYRRVIPAARARRAIRACIFV